MAACDLRFRSVVRSPWRCSSMMNSCSQHRKMVFLTQYIPAFGEDRFRIAMCCYEHVMRIGTSFFAFLRIVVHAQECSESLVYFFKLCTFCSGC